MVAIKRMAAGDNIDQARQQALQFLVKLQKKKKHLTILVKQTYFPKSTSRIYLMIADQNLICWQEKVWYPKQSSKI